MAQPLKKKESRRAGFSVDSLKADIGLKEVSSADKPIEWLVMPKAFQDALHLPGIPMGYFSTIIGHSNTGKSTLVNHTIVAAQQQGLLPIIFDTENNFDFKYAIDMGMEAEPVEGDVEVEKIDPVTGEVSVTVERQIVDWKGNFIYFNNTALLERYGHKNYVSGKDEKTRRDTPVIEDIAYSISEFLDLQRDGKIPMGIVFIWDSVGSIPCFKCVNSKNYNAMWDAAALSQSFTTILNGRIPASRKSDSEYTNSMVVVNKVWLDSMTNPMGPPSIQLKGGNSFFYATRLMILMGGQLKSSVKKITATSKGLNYTFGTQSKIKVMKNQLPSPWTVSYEGEVICTPHGMVSADKESLDAYKKEHIPDILKSLEDMAKESGRVLQFGESDISFTETEEEE